MNRKFSRMAQRTGKIIIISKFHASLHQQERLLESGIIQDDLESFYFSLLKTGEQKFPGVITHTFAIAVLLRHIATVVNDNDKGVVPDGSCC
jgi:hypothetical protein